MAAERPDLWSTNGPEDFQELVFTVFSRRLYKDWFLFVDDLSVATGRKKCHKDGPSAATDVSCTLEREPESEKEAAGRNHTAASFTSPFAHVMSWIVQWMIWFCTAMCALIVWGFVFWAPTRDAKRSVASKAEQERTARRGGRVHHRIHTPYIVSG